jgi:hypothetical protein
MILYIVPIPTLECVACAPHHQDKRQPKMTPSGVVVNKESFKCSCFGGRGSCAAFNCNPQFPSCFHHFSNLTWFKIMPQ